MASCPASHPDGNTAGCSPSKSGRGLAERQDSRRVSGPAGNRARHLPENADRNRESNPSGNSAGRSAGCLWDHGDSSEEGNLQTSLGNNGADDPADYSERLPAEGVTGRAEPGREPRPSEWPGTKAWKPFPCG
jgi:hypothetical protein